MNWSLAILGVEGLFVQILVVAKVMGVFKLGKVNLTDGESRIMPSSEGFMQGYNARAAVEIESHLIVENHITQRSNDKREIEPTLKGLKATEAHLGKAEGLLADAGYFSAENVTRCEDSLITPYISDHRERHNLLWDERFKMPPPCPQDADAVTAMAYRLRTVEGKAVYAKLNYPAAS